MKWVTKKKNFMETWIMFMIQKVLKQIKENFIQEYHCLYLDQ